MKKPFILFILLIMSFSFLWSIDVVFKVNMNYQIQLGNFDPATNFVDVAGNFNGWGGSGAMDDTDADGIYEQTLTGFNVGDNLEFKFRINGDWNTAEFPGGSNRTYTVIDGSNVIDVWYNDQEATGEVATITFIVDDSGNQTHTAFYLKGSWDSNGVYDSGWNGGAEHSAFYDDGTHGDATAGDHIFTVQQDLVSDNGDHNWEWGVNDENHNWLDGNWQFQVVDGTAQTLTYTIPGGTSQDVDVTFNVDMSVQSNVTSVQLAGDFTNWGDNAIEMIDIGDGLWTITVTFPQGSDYDHEYKFIKNGTDWESIANRTFTIDDSEESMDLPVVYFNNEEPTPTTNQDVTVTFKVYMAKLDSSWYSNGVSIQGSVAPLDWNAGSTPMTVTLGNDKLYYVNVTFPAGSPINVEYKFTRNDDSRAWQWESVNNRSFTINDSSSTQTLEVNYWNDEMPAPENVTISIQGDNTVISWDEIPGASGYNIFRDTDPFGNFGNMLNTQPIVGTSYVDTNSTGDEKYFYKVKAFQ